MKKKTKRKGKHFPRLPLIIGAVIAILILAGFTSWFLTKEVSFEKAMRKPDLRDSYIEKIVKEIGKPEYVNYIYYADTQEEMEFLEKDYKFVFNPKGAMISFGEIETADNYIAVFPYAFSGELLKNEEDFISIFLHEYRHAKIAHEGKIDSIEISFFITLDGKLNELLLEDIAELDAMRMELTNQHLKISSNYRDDLLFGYLINYTNIWDHMKNMEPKFVEFLKIEFFEPWFLESPYLVKEKQAWYFKNQKTGREYYLPKEIINKYNQNSKG